MLGGGGNNSNLKYIYFYFPRNSNKIAIFYLNRLSRSCTRHTPVTQSPIHAHATVGLFHSIQYQIHDVGEALLVWWFGELVRQLDGFEAVLAGQEARLFESLRFVHELVSFLDVSGLLEASHDHWIQLRVLKRHEKIEI